MKTYTYKQHDFQLSDHLTAVKKVKNPNGTTTTYSRKLYDVFGFTGIKFANEKPYLYSIKDCIKYINVKIDNDRRMQK